MRGRPSRAPAERAPVRVVRVPFLVPRWAAAQVLTPRTVLVRRDARLSDRLLAHELAHVDQIERMGPVRYWATYLVGLARHGYRRHPMEAEARRAETDAASLARARRILRDDAA